jgi:hypothetical protein
MMMVRSSFLTVSVRMEASGLTRLMPSGVSSKAQAKTSVNTRPTAISTSMVFITHSGVPNLSNNSSSTCAAQAAEHFGCQRQVGGGSGACQRVKPDLVETWESLVTC